MAAENRTSYVGPLTGSDFADDIPVPAPSRWDNVPPCTCHNRWPGCQGACEACPPEPTGPVWFQFTERHPVIVAIAAVGLGMCTVLWD